MIDPETGIVAYVAPFGPGKKFEEWEPPLNSCLWTAPHHISLGNQGYIPAVTGQRFVVGVRIPESFDFRGYEYVAVVININNRAVFQSNILRRAPQGDTRREIGSYTAKINSVWRHRGFIFTELQSGMKPTSFATSKY